MISYYKRICTVVNDFFKARSRDLAQLWRNLSFPATRYELSAAVWKLPCRALGFPAGGGRFSGIIRTTGLTRCS